MMDQPSHAEYHWLWLKGVEQGYDDNLLTRFPVPAGCQRVDVGGTGVDLQWGGWLRTLPLLPAGTQVHLYNGQPKAEQRFHAAVVRLDVGKEDLQQCADAVMRLRAEFQSSFTSRGPIKFLLCSGKTLVYDNNIATRSLYDYLREVYSFANTESLAKQLRPVARLSLAQPGDVLITPGAPGHAALVLDIAENFVTHERYALLGQSFMPAQQFHVLLNKPRLGLGAWYKLEDGRPVELPEWTFAPDALKRF